MLTGLRTFKGETAAEIMTAILHHDPEDPSTSSEAVPSGLDRIVRQRRRRTRRGVFTPPTISVSRCAMPPPIRLCFGRFPWSAARGTSRCGGQRRGSRAGDRRDRRRNTTARVGRPLNAAIDSLAILPLVNASGDPDMEFLGDGITEGLINRLSQLPGLRVMARTTVFRYKNQAVDPQEVGRALQVQAVLTGQLGAATR